MALIGDLVLQTANAPGTATFSLIAPVTGRNSFVGGNGAGQAYYIATDGTNWEKGYGTVVAGSPDTLSRDTVIRNNVGTTAKINFTSTVTILSDVPAERAIYAIADNGSVAMAGRAVTGLGAAFAADHAPRFDQVRWTTRATAIVSSAQAVVVFSIPTDCVRIALDIQDTAPAAYGVLPYIRFSYDGGATYAAGASEYVAVMNGTVVTTTFAQLAPSISAGVISGRLECGTGGSHLGRTDFELVSSGTFTRSSGGLYTATGSTATHIQFGFGGQNVVAGRFNLIGMAS